MVNANTKLCNTLSSLSKVEKEREIVEEGLEDISFLDSLYHQERIDFEVEPEELVALSLMKLEKAIDQLPLNMKHAYYLAIEEEIKQSTNYVRSKKFQLMFLRAESFDVQRAAVRVAKFFQFKLDLFGRERLPHLIHESDLTDKDNEVLATGWMQFVGVDCAGRTLCLYQRRCLQVAGFLNEKYIKTIARGSFFLNMRQIEANKDNCQTKGGGGISWNFDCSQTLKDYRVLLRANISMSMEAMPIRCTAIHICHNKTLATKCFEGVMSVLPKQKQQKTIFHNGITQADCLAQLSRYGVNVACLPIGLPCKEFMRRANYNQPNESSEKVSLQRQQQQEYNKTFEIHEPSLIPIMNPDEFDEENAHFPPFCIPPFSMQSKQHDVCKDSAVISEKGAISPSLSMQPKQGEVSKALFVVGKNAAIGHSRCSSDKSKSRAIGKGDKREKLPGLLRKFLDGNIVPDTMSWISEGNAIGIKRNKEIDSVLKQHFHGIKLKSFYRAMDRWGFERLTDAELPVEFHKGYRHALFRRDLPLSPDRWQYVEKMEHVSTPKGKFFKKLYDIIQQSEDDAIWWIECSDKRGSISSEKPSNCFAIHKTNFSRDILPQHYNGIKFRSFLRSLKRWGFQQSLKNDHDNIFIFQHQIFGRSWPESLSSF